MRMSAVLKSIFAPNDGSRKEVHRKVVESRERVQQAANRVEETIREMLDRNDRLTGRAHGQQHGNSH